MIRYATAGPHQFPPDYCLSCGAVVVDKMTHDRWHDDVQMIEWNND